MDEQIKTVWRAAMIAACNILIDRQNRLNDEDGPSDILDEQGACIAALKDWMEPDAGHIHDLKAMLGRAWQPADTAPLDQQVLTWHARAGYRTMVRAVVDDPNRPQWWCGMDDDQHYMVVGPTHAPTDWMRLPPEPEGTHD